MSSSVGHPLDLPVGRAPQSLCYSRPDAELLASAGAPTARGRARAGGRVRRLRVVPPLAGRQRSGAGLPAALHARRRHRLPAPAGSVGGVHDPRVLDADRDQRAGRARRGHRPQAARRTPRRRPRRLAGARGAGAARGDVLRPPPGPAQRRRAGRCPLPRDQRRRPGLRPGRGAALLPPRRLALRRRPGAGRDLRRQRRRRGPRRGVAARRLAPARRRRGRRDRAHAAPHRAPQHGAADRPPARGPGARPGRRHGRAEPAGGELPGDAAGVHHRRPRRGGAGPRHVVAGGPGGRRPPGDRADAGALPARSGRVRAAARRHRADGRPDREGRRDRALQRRRWRRSACPPSICCRRCGRRRTASSSPAPCTSPPPATPRWPPRSRRSSGASTSSIRRRARSGLQLDPLRRLLRGRLRGLPAARASRPEPVAARRQLLLLRGLGLALHRAAGGVDAGQLLGRRRPRPAGRAGLARGVAARPVGRARLPARRARLLQVRRLLRRLGGAGAVDHRLRRRRSGPRHRPAARHLVLHVHGDGLRRRRVPRRHGAGRQPGRLRALRRLLPAPRGRTDPARAGADAAVRGAAHDPARGSVDRRLADRHRPASRRSSSPTTCRRWSTRCSRRRFRPPAATC